MVACLDSQDSTTYTNITSSECGTGETCSIYYAYPYIDLEEIFEIEQKTDIECQRPLSRIDYTKINNITLLPVLNYRVLRCNRKGIGLRLKRYR